MCDDIDPRQQIRELGSAEERRRTARECGFFEMYDDEANIRLARQVSSSPSQRCIQPRCSGCGRFL